MGLFSFLSNKLPIDTQRIEQAIADLEQKTSAELRVVVERKAKIGKTDNAAMLRASELFDELKMRETAEHNGVLIYLSFKPHYAAIIGDEGIHQKVDNDFGKKSMPQCVWTANKAITPKPFVMQSKWWKLRSLTISLIRLMIKTSFQTRW